MEATIKRRRATVSLPEYMLADLGNEARKRKTTVSSLIEEFMESMLYKPNKTTLEALEEARSGKYAGVVDVSSVEAMTRSILG